MLDKVETLHKCMDCFLEEEIYFTDYFRNKFSNWECPECGSTNIKIYKPE